MAGEVTYQLSEADYVAANQDWFRRAILRRRTLLRHVAAILVAFMLGVGLMRGDGSFAWVQLVYGAAAAGTMIAFLALLYLTSYALLPRRAGKLFRQQTAIQKPMTFSWTDDGMVQASAHGVGTYQWRDLHRWTAGRDGIMPYVNDQLYFIVPRRALSDIQLDDLIATLERSGLARY